MRGLDGRWIFRADEAVCSETQQRCIVRNEATSRRKRRLPDMPPKYQWFHKFPLKSLNKAVIAWARKQACLENRRGWPRES